MFLKERAGIAGVGDSMDMQTESILQGGYFKKMLDEQSAELRQKYNQKKAELEILYFLSQWRISKSMWVITAIKMR